MEDARRVASHEDRPDRSDSPRLYWATSYYDNAVSTEPRKGRNVNGRRKGSKDGEGEKRTGSVLFRCNRFDDIQIVTKSTRGGFSRDTLDAVTAADLR